MQESGRIAPLANEIRNINAPTAADGIMEFNPHVHSEGMKNSLEQGRPTDSGNFFWEWYDPKTNKKYKITTGFPALFLRLDQELAITAGMQHLNILWSAVSNRKKDYFESYYNQSRHEEKKASEIIDLIIKDITSAGFSEHDAQMSVVYLIYNRWFSPFMNFNYENGFVEGILKKIKSGEFNNLTELNNFLNNNVIFFSNQVNDIKILKPIILYLYRIMQVGNNDFEELYVGSFGGPDDYEFLNPIAKR